MAFRPAEFLSIQIARVISCDIWRSTWAQTGGLPLAGGGHTIWGSAADNLFSLGYNYGDERGYIARSSDGSNWTVVHGPTAVFLSDVWGSGATDLYSVGLAFPSRAGVVLHSADGASWGSIPTAPEAPPDLASVWGSSASDVYVVGGAPRLRYWNASNGTIQRYDGTAWTLVYTDATGHGLADVCGAGGTVWAVGGTSGEGVVMQGSGSNWTQVFTAPVQLRGVWATMD